MPRDIHSRSTLNPAAAPFRPMASLTSVSARLQVGPSAQPSTVRCTRPLLPWHCILLAAGWRTVDEDDGHSYLVGPGVDKPVIAQQEPCSENKETQKCQENTENTASGTDSEPETGDRGQQTTESNLPKHHEPQAPPTAKDVLETDELTDLMEFAPYFCPQRDHQEDNVPKDKGKAVDLTHIQHPDDPEPDNPEEGEDEDGYIHVEHYTQEHESDDERLANFHKWPDVAPGADEAEGDWVWVQETDSRPVGGDETHPSAENGADLSGAQPKRRGYWQWWKK